jgi:hypothetical protein
MPINQRTTAWLFLVAATRVLNRLRTRWKDRQKTLSLVPGHPRVALHHEHRPRALLLAEAGRRCQAAARTQVQLRGQMKETRPQLGSQQADEEKRLKPVAGWQYITVR